MWSSRRCKSECQCLWNQWTKMDGNGKFNSDDHYIYYCGQESLRRNGVAIIDDKRVWNGVVGCNPQSDRMILVCYQGEPFNITVIQLYAPATKVKEGEVEQFCEELQDLLELTPNMIGDWSAKLGG